jgi:hypothetical protein
MDVHNPDLKRPQKERKQNLYKRLWPEGITDDVVQALRISPAPLPRLAIEKSVRGRAMRRAETG